MSKEGKAYQFALIGQYRCHPLQGEVMVIGRNHTIPCFRYPEDLNEPFPLLSRLHAVLYPWGHTYAIYDLQSQKGVFVNGKRMNGEHRLRLDDVIELGDLRVSFGLNDKKTFEEPRPLHREEEHVYPGPVSPLHLGKLLLEVREKLHGVKNANEIIDLALFYAQQLTYADKASIIIEDNGFFKGRGHSRLRQTDGGKKIHEPTEASLVPASVWSHLRGRSIVLFGRTAFGLVNPGPFNICSVISVLALPLVNDNRLLGALIVENYKGSHRFIAGMAFATLVLAELTAKPLSQTDLWKPQAKTPVWKPPLREAPYETIEISGPTGKQLLDHRCQLFCGTPCKIMGDSLFENQPSRALLIPEKGPREPMRIFPLANHKVTINGKAVKFGEEVNAGDQVTIDDEKFTFDKVLAYSDEILRNSKRAPGDVDLQRYLQINWHKEANLPKDLLPDDSFIFWPDRLEQ